METAGDCYIVAGALMRRDEHGFTSLDEDPDAVEGASNVLDFAQAMLRQARTVIMPHNQQPTCIRIGLHTGSVVRLVGTYYNAMAFALQCELTARASLAHTCVSLPCAALWGSVLGYSTAT